MIFECVVNVSEGRDDATVADLAGAAGGALLDVHRDPDHNRAVLTLGGDAAVVTLAVRSLATAAVERLDLSTHEGAHPRFGVLDVVPFVPFEPGRPAPDDLRDAATLRDGFARWLGEEVGVPAFVYGPLPDGATRSLPDVRRAAFTGLHPDFGPAKPDPRAGATAVGARRVLVAYNVWVDSVAAARQVAAAVRGPAVRALGLAVGDRAQVSCNLIEPDRVGPDRVYDEVAGLVGTAGGHVEGAELVGLIPEAVLHAIPAARWRTLGLSDESTVEARLDAGPGPLVETT